MFQWSAGSPVSGSNSFIRVAEVQEFHSSLEDAIEDQRVLPFEQAEDWYLIENVTSSFQYPFSGAYPLEAGKTYCWQIRMTLPTTAGEDDLLSQIFAFKIGDAGVIQTTGSITDPFLLMLKQALGDDQFNTLFGPGNSLEGFAPNGQMEINGATVDQTSVNYLLNQILSQNYQINSIQVEE